MNSILIVDDNLVSLKQISSQLVGSYEVSLAKSGELALQICERTQPDVILLDVEMPEMDGFETIECLKKDPKLKHIPVIFLTGNHDAATEIKCLESGAMDFITKPANVDILRHRIKLHLEFSHYQLHLEQMVRELEDNIGISFAELLDCKDFNIADHVLRAGEYAEMLMRELYESKIYGEAAVKFEDIDEIRRAAPFHDIGKIGISDIILLKRSPLTKEEYAEICKHTTIGARVLKVIYDRTPDQHYLKTAITIAEGHHERYDGSGYPQGLKGDEIPISCQVMALANVYDAYITDRVYRKGVTHEDAANIIMEARGTEFDPRLVDAFVRIKDKFATIQVSAKVSLIDKGWNFNHETNTGS